MNKKYNNRIKIIFFVVSILIILLLLSFCQRQDKVVLDGIRITNIKQSVDSFNGDTIFINNNYIKDKTYEYDVTIHNYLKEDYYLYKIEINNGNITHNDILKLLKNQNDTNIKLKLSSKEDINERFNIKFYYGKLKEVKIGDEIVSFFEGEKVILPNGIEKEGYEFLGYTDIEGSNKVKYFVNTEYDFKNGTVLYPIYKEKDKEDNNANNNQDNNNNNNVLKKYTISFDSQNGETFTSKEVIYGEKFGDLPTPNKTGFLFIGWYLVNDLITNETIVNINENVTLKAKYNIINYPINYELDGGNANNPGSFTIQSSDITLENPIKPGAVFVGWTGSNGDIPEKNVTIKSGSTGSRRYIANYSINDIVSYKVIHKLEKLDGTFEKKSEENFSAPYGTIVSPNVKQYEGFVSPNAKSVTINQNGSTEVEYEYLRKKYTLSYSNKENIDLENSSKEKEYKYEEEIEIVAKEKVGYTFTGWSNGLTTRVARFKINNNINIAPVYTPKKYNVIFNSNGAQGTMNNQEFTYDNVQELSENLFTKEGYEFIGWNTKADGSDDTTYNDKQAVKNLTTSGDITLYAQFIIKTYTVKFDTDGGDIVPSITRTHGKNIGVLQEPEKLGYTFVGWYIGNEKIESTYVVTNNITLKAKYNIINYTINYDLDGGIAENPDRYTVEDEIILNNPSKMGYTFAGWTGSNGENLQTKVTIMKGTTDNLNYKANYSVNQNTPYKVIHKVQNLSLNGYDVKLIESLTGATNTTVNPEVKDFDGFTSPQKGSLLIKADGTSTIEYLYERNIYSYSLSNKNDIDLANSTTEGNYPFDTIIKVVAKEKEGYTFTGWSNGLTSLSIEFNISDNVVLYPKYDKNKYTIIYNNNTGSGTMANQEFTYDIEQKLNKNAFVKSGYTFEKWNTKADGTGTSYIDEQLVLNLKSKGSMVLYAQWKANTNTPYKVIHKKQNIDLNFYTDEVENLTGTTDSIITPSVRNYTGFIIPSAKEIIIKGDGSTIVEYIYTRKTYTFTLENRDRVETDKEDGIYPYETSISLKAKDIPGYTFTAWSNGDESKRINIVVTENISISPLYSANTNTPYKVIHKKQNVDLNSYTDEVENLTGTTDALVAPNVRNYTGFTSPSAREMLIKGDGSSTLEYIYTRRTYTFNIENRENVETDKENGVYPYETQITLKAKDIPGYTFTGWTNGKTSNELTITLEENISIKPLYTANINTPYKVVHRKQNVDLTTYTDEVENLTGTTDSIITPSVRNYTGFIIPSVNELIIKGDGTSELVYIYTRRTYTFNIENRENVETNKENGVYPYETQITLKAKDIPGYTFTGWSNGKTSNELTITLEENISIKPLYTANINTPYKVVHRKQNVDLTTYTDEVENLTGTTDALVTPSVKTYEGFNSPSVNELIIKGDGTSELVYIYKRKTYTFTLEDSDKVISNLVSGDYPYETNISLSAKTIPGYTFVGWSNGDENVEITLSLKDNINIKPLYASRNDTPYKVIHKKQNLDLTTYTNVVENFVGATDSEVTPDVKEFTGFISPSTKNVTIKGDGSSTVEYIYTRRKYTFTLENREYVETNKSDGEYPYETNITLKAKSKEGYTFTKWTNESTSNPTTITLIENTSIKPIYTANKYNVIFSSNTGIGNMADQQLTYDQEVALNKSTFTKNGYIFAGWNEKADGTGKPYLDEEIVKNIKSSGSIILYAQWVARDDIPYKVIHRKQNLDLTTYTEEVENLTGTTDTLVTPSVKTYEGFTSPSEAEMIVKADGTSEIIYVYNRIMYTFTLNNIENVETSVQSGEYPYETPISLKAQEVPGYTFTGWTNGENENEITILLTDNIEISPIYTANTDTPYKVIHRKQNLDLTTYTEEVENLTGTTDTLVTPSVKTYEGFTSPSEAEMIVKADGTSEIIYVYNRIMYTFTLNNIENVETSVQSGEYPYETPISLKAQEVPGYTFTGWTNGENENEITVLLTDNIEISPIYTANTNTPYKVIHRKQNLDLTTYTEEVENLTGTTDAKATPSVKIYEGFTSPSAKEITIKGDGTSEVIYTYNRIMYTFTLEDREYVETETVDGEYPYGTFITLTAKNKIGYTFTSWNDGNTTNPYIIHVEQNLIVKPLYSANTDTPYKVIHKKQNLDLTSYTDEVENLTGTTDELVTPNVRNYTGFTSPSAREILIKGDGSSIVEYIYTRKMFRFSIIDREYVETDKADGNYPYETQITLTAKDKKGYTFTGWSNNQTTKSITISLIEPITLQPIYEINSYTVTFNPNGGTVSETSRQVTYNEKVGELPIAEKEDNVFVGWYTGITDGDPIDENFVIEDNVILYAHYTDPHAVFTYGSVVNQIMNNLAGDNTITSIRQYKQKPDSSVMTDDNIVSDRDESNTPIYMWYSDNTLYYYSIDKKPYLNSDSSGMFRGFSNITYIEGLDNFRTENLVSMDYMFKYCFNLTNIDLSKWNTDKLQNMHHAFEDVFVYNTNNYSLNISGFDLQKINNNSTQIDNYLFGSNLKNDVNVTLKTNNIILPSNSSYLFSSLKGFTLEGIDTWNTSNVTNMNYMFKDESLSKTLTVDLSNWNISKVVSMLNIFENSYSDTTKSYTLNINNFDLSKIDIGYNVGYLFGNEVNGDIKVTLKANNIKLPSNSNYLFAYLSGFTIEGIDTWDTSKVEDMSYMLSEGTLNNLTNIDLSSWNTNKVDNMYYIFNKSFKNGKEDYILNISNWDMSKVGTSDEENYLFGDTNNAKGTIITNNIKLPVYSNYFFAYLQDFSLEGIHTWDTSLVEDMSYLFAYGSISKNTLSLNSFDTTKVESMEGMFKDNPNLTLLDITSFNTSNVTNMKNMLSGCSNLTTIYVSDIFTTEKVESSDNMFLDDTNIIGGRGTTYDQNHIDKSYAHYDYGVSNPGYFINGTIYTITFNPNGGVLDDLSRQLIYGSKLGKLPEPYKDNNLFLGWYTGITDGDPIDENTIVEGNTVYYARWEPIKTVTFNSNSGYFDENETSNVIRYLSIGYQEETSYKEPDKVEYVFIGWNTKADGTGTSYLNEQEVLNSIEIIDNQTLYAQWVKAVSTFDIGQNVNDKLKTLAGLSSNITSIVKSNTKPDLSTMTDENIISISTLSNTPIYAWYENGIIYYYSKASELYLNPDSSQMFANLSNITTLDLSNIDTSRTTNMSGMFAACSNLKTLNINNFNTSNVTDMSYMFTACTSIESLDLSNLNTSNVENMSGMFANCHKLSSINVSNFDTRKVINMSNMFLDCQKLSSINVSNFDTSNVTDMSYMFTACTSLESLDLSHFNISNVENISQMFTALINLKSLDISNWNFAKITSLSEMFKNGLSKLETIKLENVNTSNITDMSSMFYGCSSLKSIDLSSFNTSNVRDLSAMFALCTSLEELDLSYFDVSKVNSFYGFVGSDTSLKTLNVSGWNFDSVTSLSSIFAGLSSLEAINLENINTSKITDMSRMFDKCSSIRELDLSNLDTSLVTNYTDMFRDCTSLETLNLSNFDFSKTNNTSVMFNISYGTLNSLKTLILDNTKYSSDMTNAFGGLTQIETISLKNINTSHVTNMNALFYSDPRLTTVDLSSFDTSNVLSMTDMFYGCSSIESLDLRNFDTRNVTEMNRMFGNMSNIKTIKVTDSFVVDNVTSSNEMFSLDTRIVGSQGTTYDENHIEKEYAHIDGGTSNPGYFTDGNTYTITFNLNGGTSSDELTKELIYGSKLGILPNAQKENRLFIGWYTGITDGDPIDENIIVRGNTIYYAHYVELKATFDTGKNVNAKIKKLASTSDATYETINTNITSIVKSTTQPELSLMTSDNIISSSYLPIYAWYENGVLYYWSIANELYLNEDSSYMFNNLSGLTSVGGIDTLNTGNVTDMSYMFKGCSNISTLDLSSWNTSNIENMSSSFAACDNLTSLNISNFDTSNVTQMNGMFNNCASLTTLDLSSFNTTNVTDMSSMFESCNNLKTIYVSNSFVTNKVSNSSSMFDSATMLVGGAGTTYNSSHVEKDYAHIDGGTRNPGYFTYKTFASSYTISFNANNGIGEMEDQTINPQVDNVLSANTFTRSTYKFIGWNTKVDGTGIEYLDKDTVEKSTITSDITLYAQWLRHGWIFENKDELDNYQNNLLGQKWIYYEDGIQIIDRLINVYSNNNEVGTKHNYLIQQDGYMHIGWYEDNGDYYYYSTFDDDKNGYVDGFRLERQIREIDGRYYEFDLNGVCINYDDTLTATFDTGSSVNSKLKSLAGSSSNIKSIQKSVKMPNMDSMTEDNIISSEDSDLKIYAWYEDNKIYYWSVASRLYLNEDSSNMFNNLSELTSVSDINTINASNVEDMSHMFEGSSNLTTLDLSSWNTSNVTNMEEMFNGLESLTMLNISEWDLTNINKEEQSDLYDVDNYLFGYMDSGTATLETYEIKTRLITNNIKLPSDSSYLFAGLNTYGIEGIETWDTSNVTNMEGVVAATIINQENLNLNTWDISNITNMKNMLKASLVKVSNLNVSSWDTSKVTNMKSMFQGNSLMTSIDVSNFDTKNVIDFSYMLDIPSLKTVNISNLDMSNWSIPSYDDYYSLFAGFSHTKSIETINMTNAKLPSNSSNLFANFKNLTSIVGSNTIDTSNVTNMSGMFSGCSSLSNLDLSNLDTSNVEDMSYMFYNCESLTELDLSNWNVSNLTNIEYMFEECNNLTTLNVSGWEIGANTDIEYIFENLDSLTTLNMSNWDMTNMNNDSYEYNSYLFGSVGSISTIDSYEIKTRLITNNIKLPSDSSYLFAGLNTYGIEGIETWDTSNVTNMKGVVAGTIINQENVNLSNWNVSNVTNMESIFKSSLIKVSSLDVSTWNTSNVTNMEKMFEGNSLITSLDLSNFNTSNVTNFKNILNIPSLKTVNISNFDMSHCGEDGYNKILFAYNGGIDLSIETIDMTNVKLPSDSSYFFANLIHLNNIVGSNTIDTSNVEDMSYMFEDCSSLTELDLSNWNTSNVTNMEYMFEDCSSLTELDLSNWDVSKVTNMHDMFGSYNINITKLNVSDWKISANTDIEDIFEDLDSLTTLNMSNWDMTNINNNSYEYDSYLFGSVASTSTLSTEEVRTRLITNNIKLPSNSSYLFAGLQYYGIEGIETWDTSRVTNMEGLVGGTLINQENVDLNSWNVSNVTNMFETFRGSLLKVSQLKMNNWNVSNVTTMHRMMQSYNSIKSIDLSSWNISNVTDFEKIFDGWFSLETLNISNWDLSKWNRRATTWYIEPLLIHNTSIKSLIVNNVKLPEDSSYLFSSLYVEELDLSTVDTSKVTDMSGMFEYSESLTTIYATDSFVTTAVNYSSDMFYGCENLVGGNGTRYDGEHTDKEYARIDRVGTPGYFTYKASGGQPGYVQITFDSNEGTGSMDIQEINPSQSNIINANTFTRDGYAFIGWNTETDGTGTAYVDEATIPAGTITEYTTLYAQWLRQGWHFENKNEFDNPQEHLKEQKWTYYRDGEKVQNELLYVTGTYEELTVSKHYYLIENGYMYIGWHQNENNEWNFYSWFSNNEYGYVQGHRLENISKEIDGETYIFDENGVCTNCNFKATFDIGKNVNDKLKTLASSPSITSIVRYTNKPSNDILNNAQIISSDDSLIPIYAWYENGTIYYYSQASTLYLNEDSSYMFSNLSIEELDLSSLNTSNVTNMQYIFGSLDSLTMLNISNWDMSKVNSSCYSYCGYSYLFDWIGSISTITDDEIKTRLITNNIKLPSNSSYLFAGLQYYGIEGIETWDTSRVTNMEGLVGGTLINQESLDLTNWNVSNVTNMSYTFTGSLLKVSELDVSTWNTSKVTNMNRLFQGVTSITSLDLSTWDTSNVEYFDHMFDIVGISTLNISNFDMRKWIRNGMYNSLFGGSRYYSSEFNKIIISNAKLPEDCQTLFAAIGGLTEIVGLNTVDTSIVENMTGMFSGLSNITTLDLSSFDTSKVTDMSTMFAYCENLTTIYVNESFVTSDSGYNMFYEDHKLVGGNGTTYDEYHIDEEYARIDRVGTPGYFTYKASGGIIPSTGDVTISFNSNGGTGTMENQVIDSSKNYILNENEFTRSGYKFVGWNTETDGSGTSYSNKQSLPANTLTSNTTLYAQWVKHGWQFENKDEFDNPGEHLKEQKWSYYRDGTRVENELIYVEGTYEELTVSKHYYLIEDGYMYIGWKKNSNNKWNFYSWFSTNEYGYVQGHRLQGTDSQGYEKEIDGVTYIFDENGESNIDPPSSVINSAGANITKFINRSKFKIPEGSYELRKYFMGIGY